MTGKSETPCGQNCNDCGQFKYACRGCMNTEGVPFWIVQTPMDLCPIFSCCATGKELEHCGDCPEYPCSTYMGLRDPSMTDEEWDRSVSDRRTNLMSRKKS